MKQPSKFTTDANIHIFTEDAEPFWEHKANTNGGRWMTTICKPANPEDAFDADEKWLNLCLAVFGGEVPAINTEVVGIIASHRRNYVRISIWTRDKTREAVLEIGKYIKSAIGISEFEYQDHGADYNKFRHKLV